MSYTQYLRAEKHCLDACLEAPVEANPAFAQRHSPALQMHWNSVVTVLLQSSFFCVPVVTGLLTCLPARHSALEDDSSFTLVLT